MKKYDVEIMKFNELKNEIEVPRFQRSPIWKDEKKKNLIETIKKVYLLEVYYFRNKTIQTNYC